MDRRWTEMVAGGHAGAIGQGTSIRLMSPGMRREVQMWGLDLPCEKEAALKSVMLR